MGVDITYIENIRNYNDCLMRDSGKMKGGLLAGAFSSSLRRIHDLLVVQGLRRISIF